MFGIGRAKNIVGVDIGSYAVKVIELKASTKDEQESFEVRSIGYEKLPHDAIVDGMIIDSAAVAETIKAVFEEAKIKNKNVAISISGNAVIIKKIALPSMETEELAESIIWEARHNIPYPYEETTVDYATLRPSDDSEEKNTNILLVAAKKEKISNYRAAVNQARKKLQVIDVDVFALQNAFEVNYPDVFREKTAALINIGANNTNIIIVERGIPQLFRDLAMGGSLFAEHVSKDLHIGIDDAEKFLMGIPSEKFPSDQVETILDMNIQNIAEELEKTFSFFEAGEKQANSIDIILLSGGLSQLKDFPRKIEEKFGVKTDLFNPFRRIQYKESRLDSLYFQEMAPLFSVAAGLAIRKAGR